MKRTLREGKEIESERKIDAQTVTASKLWSSPLLEVIIFFWTTAVNLSFAFRTPSTISWKDCKEIWESREMS